MMLSNDDTIIINFTPTGMVPTKAMTPHVPVSVSEIIDDVHHAHELGITIVHLHARDESTGDPTHDAGIYARIIEGIRRFSRDLVICVSLSGRTCNEYDKRAAPLFLDGAAKPDMGSLTLSSLNFNRTASVNEPGMIIRLAETMRERGIKPELEAFDAGMINFARYLIAKGMLAPPYYFNLILGNIACAQADLLHAGIMIRDLPEHSMWALGGVGNAQLPMNSVAISLGGGVRVGLEDNIWLDATRTRLATNADLLTRVHALIATHGRRFLPPSELRRRLLDTVPYADAR